MKRHLRIVDSVADPQRRTRKEIYDEMIDLIPVYSEAVPELPVANLMLNRYGMFDCKLLTIEQLEDLVSAMKEGMKK